MREGAEGEGGGQVREEDKVREGAEGEGGCRR